MTTMRSNWVRSVITGCRIICHCILEAGPQEEPQLYFSQSAERIFSSLAAGAGHLTYGRLCEALESGELFTSGGKKKPDTY